MRLAPRAFTYRDHIGAGRDMYPIEKLKLRILEQLAIRAHRLHDLPGSSIKTRQAVYALIAEGKVRMKEGVNTQQGLRPVHFYELVT